jgi:hypothetical protein
VAENHTLFIKCGVVGVVSALCTVAQSPPPPNFFHFLAPKAFYKKKEKKRSLLWLTLLRCCDVVMF